uniref:Uncharacterized protein n=1 Tax=Romanomermis culicivorax TaxID=13658 RepID=A0A915JC12_ROMCU
YFAVYSCFGGVNDNFVASGSEGVRNANGTEDFHVYVWRRDGQSEEPVVVLKGHHNVVNAVAWNPVDPTIMASCSDDGTVRIWGPPGRTRSASFSDEMNTD